MSYSHEGHYSVKPRKRFGQNFLVSQSAIDEISDGIACPENCTLIEIGPGKGALTLRLLEKTNCLHVVEIDRDLVRQLQVKFFNEIALGKLVIHEGDVLKIDIGKLGERLVIVGNLPYNISTPLLFHLAQYQSCIHEMNFMLQEEVVNRLVAKVSTKAYGRLTVMMQRYFLMEKKLIIKPDSFWPVPKVHSATIGFYPLLKTIDATVEPLFSHVVNVAFQKRRKILRNALSSLVTEEDLISAGIDPLSRAEDISVEIYMRLAEILGKKQAP